MTGAGTFWLRRQKLVQPPPLPPWRVRAELDLAALKEKARSLKGDLLADQEVVTQKASTTPFREVPRFDLPEVDVSMLRGRMTPQQAHHALYRSDARPSTRVRHFVVANLHGCEYAALDTSHGASPYHVSVTAPVDVGDIEDVIQWWGNPSRVTLEALAEGSDSREGGSSK